jgi:hypothetical protein
MAITSYSTLQTTVGDWLNRSDLTTVIPDFITLAEAQFNRTLRHRKMVERATATLDTEYSAMPADWLESIRYQLNTNPITVMEFVSPDQAAMLKGAYSTSGKPIFYSQIGQQFQVIPAPDSGSAYTGELTYYAKIPALSAGNTSNWLLVDSPDIYLYGALLQSAPYLQDDQRLNIWAAIYQRLIEDLKVSDERSRMATSSLRMRARSLG